MKFELNGLISSGLLIKQPDELEEMIEVSEKLPAGIDYLRVDLYNPKGKGVLVGELTNYPIAGQMKFAHLGLYREFGQKLILDKR